MCKKYVKKRKSSAPEVTEFIIANIHQITKPTNHCVYNKLPINFEDCIFVNFQNSSLTFLGILEIKNG
jgi:hypothetical protein